MSIRLRLSMYEDFSILNFFLWQWFLVFFLFYSSDWDWWRLWLKIFSPSWRLKVLIVEFLLGKLLTKCQGKNKFGMYFDRLGTEKRDRRVLSWAALMSAVMNIARFGVLSWRDGRWWGSTLLVRLAARTSPFLWIIFLPPMGVVFYGQLITRAWCTPDICMLRRVITPPEAKRNYIKQLGYCALVSLLFNF